MIKHLDSDIGSTKNNLAATTKLNLKSFLTLIYKFPENYKCITSQESSFEKIFNPSSSLNEEESVEYFFNSNKEFIFEKKKIFKIYYRIRFDGFIHKKMKTVFSIISYIIKLIKN